MKHHKFGALIMALLCTSTLITAIPVSSDTLTMDTSSLLIPIDYSEYGLGCNIDDTDCDSLESIQTNYSVTPEDRITLPSSIDLSSDSAFPPIGHQGSIGSCVAWATTYYTYTYMVHYRKGITSTANNAYSPRWTYNLTNGGTDEGSTVSNALKVLYNQGALTMNECPYYISGYYSLDWSHDTQAMINALSTRSSGDSMKTVTFTYGASFLSQLEDIKAGINDHIPYIVTLKSNQGLSNGTVRYCADSSHYNQFIYVRNASTTPSGEVEDGHAMTIVGYDDTVWCDVNSNNVIDSGETGAFKVANSWGTSWKNSGYVWVLYDALLGTSQIKSAADSTVAWDAAYTTTRVPFFAQTGSTNRFYYMNSVPDYLVGFVSEVTFTTDRRNQLRATSLCTNYNFTNIESNLIYQNYSNGYASTPIGFTGTIVLNHSCSSNINSYIFGYNWGVIIQDTLPDSYPLTSISCKIVDNLENTIASYYSSGAINGTTNTLMTTINLSRGDVNYDGLKTTDDVNIMLQYLSGSIDLSNVQYRLADYNRDGFVDLFDAIDLSGDLERNGVDVTEINAKIQCFRHTGKFYDEVS